MHNPFAIVATEEKMKAAETAAVAKQVVVEQMVAAVTVGAAGTPEVLVTEVGAQLEVTETAVEGAGVAAATAAAGVLEEVERVAVGAKPEVVTMGAVKVGAATGAAGATAEAAREAVMGAVMEAAAAGWQALC